MTKRKAVFPVLQAGTLGETALNLHADSTTNSNFLPLLTPRHKRIHKALKENPAGLLSFDLRNKCGCMNIADEVMVMRRQGFDIACELEPFITCDGIKSKIGRYRLADQEVTKI